jgi:hypothetical protein
VPGAVRLLRDRKAVGGRSLALGDRKAIDALIATHGVVVDARDKVLWVSEAPHLLGRFVRFDVGRLLSDPALAKRVDLVTIAADPLLHDEAYRRYLNRSSEPAN